MQDNASFITHPSWKKYIVVSCVVETLRVRDKRHLFHIMRSAQVLDHNSFFPNYGITTGEFSVWQVLTDSRKHRRKITVRDAREAP